MNGDIDFFTATCLNWQNLLEPDQHKQVILSSLEFLVNDNRIWLYGYVIMPNHIHLLWRKQDAWIDKNIAQIFLKFTAQQIALWLVLSPTTNHYQLIKPQTSSRLQALPPCL